MPDRIGTVPGTVLKEAVQQTDTSLVSVMKAVSEGEVEVRSKGIVVAICGGGHLAQDDINSYKAQQLAAGVAARDGLIVNGGESSGLMLSVASVVRNNVLGVACPYHQTIPYINKALVNSYQTRKSIITVMPNVVVFPGQVGTLDELITCVGWIKSLLKQNAKPPHLWVDDYWWDILDLLNNKNAIQEEIWQYIHKFNDIDEILRSLK